MKFDIYLTPEATEDIKNIYSYINNVLQSPISALNTKSKIEECIYSLAEMPERLPLHPKEPWKSRGLRKCYANNYILFFVVDKDNNRVVVIRILYGGSNIDKTFQIMQ